MDALIKKANYFNASEEESEAFYEQVNDDKYDEMSIGNVNKALDALTERLKSDKWPQRNSEGHYMMERTVRRLGDSISEFEEKEVVKSIVSHIFKAAETCILTGLPASIVEILGDLIGRIPDLYYEEMPRDRFLYLLSLIKIGRYKPLKNDEAADYARSNCYEPLGRVYKQIETEMFERYIDDVIAVCHYMIVEIFKNGEDAALYFKGYLYYLRVQCDKEPLMALKKNPAQLKTYFEEYVGIVEGRSINDEETQSLVYDTFNIIYNLLRYDDVRQVGPTLVPVTLEIIGRLHAIEGKNPWLRKTIDTLVNSLRLDDKDANFVFKNITMQSMSDVWKKYFQEPDYTVKAWEKDVSNLFWMAVKPCCRTPQDCELVFPIVGNLMRWKSPKICERVEREVRDLEKPMKAALKEGVSGFVAMLEAYLALISTMNAKEEEDDEDGNKKQEELASKVKDSLEKWFTMARSVKQHSLPEIQAVLLRLLCIALRSGADDVAGIASEVAEFVTWDKQGDLTPLMDALLAMASGESGADHESVTQGSLMADIMSPLGEKAREKPEILKPHLKKIGMIMDASLKGSLWFDLNGSDFPSYHTHILINFFNLLSYGVSDAEVVNTIYPRLLRGVEVSEDFEDYHNAWRTMSMHPNTKGSATEALCKFIPQIAAGAEKGMKDGKTEHFLPAGQMLSTLCTEQTEHAAPHIGHVIRVLKASFTPEFSCLSLILMQGLGAVCKTSDRVMNKELVTVIMTSLKDDTLSYFGLEILKSISERKPELITSEIEKLREVASKSFVGAPIIFNLFEKLVEKDKTLVEQVMSALESSVQPLLRSTQPMTAVCALTVMRRIGLNFPDALRRRKKAVESWKGEPALHDTAMHLLDVIEDRTLAGVDATVTVQGAAVTAIDDRLQDTSKRVEQVDSELKVQDSRLGDVEDRQEKTEERVEVVEGDVGEIGKGMEELDNKTMTNAPRWSRSVALLLNEESDKDWRLLAQRLGFSPADIRGWATQHDPCMAVLSDWFATNRTAGATHAVRTALREMDRLDALALVEDAVDAAEGTVADGPEEYSSPPSIFLSYQWGHQPEAKMLRKHLEMAGYSCWMDVGNMGGGDKLYEAIDRGLRGAAVMVACVTPKYAQSENCRRELNLAANINKPIIPLQLLRMEWPPAGPMGPLLSEYLFIRLFSKTASKGRPNQPFWPPDRFLELLMQIRLHVAPDHDTVQTPYERWWEPPEEVIVVPQRDPGSAPAPEKETTTSVDGPPPELFLSYQWGKQPQVKRLYQKLTGLGVSCWMDIYQMGGGDSLYDKIDRGIRACKAVVACVTPKYALSANCRKEVSLSHALKKPIIPLMLEQTDWPPAGPMSMVFTELLYIGMHKSPGEQDFWEGPKTEELLGKLTELGLLSSVEKPSQTAKKSNGETVEGKDSKSESKSASSKETQSLPKASANSHSESPVKTPQAKSETPKTQTPATPRVEAEGTPKKSSKACFLL